MVAAVVAERELVGRGAERRGQQLVPEADAEHRHAVDQAGDDLGGARDRRGVAGPVRQEHTVGASGEHLVRRRGRRDHGDLAEPGQVAEDRALDPEVVRHDAPVSPAGARRHRVRLGAGDGGDQVHAVGARLGDRRRLEGDLVAGAERARHRPGLADVAGEAARVDPGDARHAVPAQVVVEAVGRPPVRPAAGQVADDDAAGEGSPALVVVGVDPVVADVRVREGDDLPRVAGVGQHLLVARQHGVEHDLAAGDSAGGLGADQLALERGAVGEDQQSLAHGHRWTRCVLGRGCCMFMQCSEYCRA